MSDDRGRHEKIYGVVLTGGVSRRMGSPKCDLVLAGRRLLEYLCSLLAERTDGVMIVGRTPDPTGTSPGVVVVPDRYPGKGPLGGIATALRQAAACSPGAGVLVVACDMVGLGGEILDHLLAGRELQAGATVPANPGSGAIEPMPGIYEAGAMDSLDDSIRAGRLSVTDWLIRTRASIQQIPPSLASQLRGANTPDELEALAHGGQYGWAGRDELCAARRRETA